MTSMGDQIEVDAAAGMRYYDLYHGVELKPEPRGSGQAVLAFSDGGEWVWRRARDAERSGR